MIHTELIFTHELFKLFMHSHQNLQGTERGGEREGGERGRKGREGGEEGGRERREGGEGGQREGEREGRGKRVRSSSSDKSFHLHLYL